MAVVSSRKSLIGGKADRILGATAVAVAAATGAGMVGTESQADADVVYFIGVNINIPSNIDGVYLDVVTGQTGTAGFAGYDVNPYSATTMNFFSPGGTNHGFVQAAAGGGTASLAYGTQIDATRTFANAAASITNEPWVLNASNLVGFRFTHEGTGQLHYGWMEIAISSALNAQPRTLVSYAYENTPGVAITAVPEPTALGLLAAGAVGLFARRRRRIA